MLRTFRYYESLSGIERKKMKLIRSMRFFNSILATISREPVSQWTKHSRPRLGCVAECESEWNHVELVAPTCSQWGVCAVPLFLFGFAFVLSFARGQALSALVQILKSCEFSEHVCVWVDSSQNWAKGQFSALLHNIMVQIYWTAMEGPCHGLH